MKDNLIKGEIEGGGKGFIGKLEPLPKQSFSFLLFFSSYYFICLQLDQAQFVNMEHTNGASLGCNLII